MLLILLFLFLWFSLSFLFSKTRDGALCTTGRVFYTLVLWVILMQFTECVVEAWRSVLPKTGG